MGLIKSVIFGFLMGLFLVSFNLIGMIPVIGQFILFVFGFCFCFILFFVSAIAGYILCKINNFKRGEYLNIGINLLLYSFVSAITYGFLNSILQMLGIGVGALMGTDLSTLGVSVGFNLIGTISYTLVYLIILAFFGGIGCVVYSINAPSRKFN